jgi:hypothetical protein
MTYEEAVLKLQNYLGSELASFECTQMPNGWDAYEFLVKRTDGAETMIHVGDPKEVNGVFLADGILDKSK